MTGASESHHVAPTCMLHCNIVVATVISGGSLREPGFRLPHPESRRLRGRWWSQQNVLSSSSSFFSSRGRERKSLALGDRDGARRRLATIVRCVAPLRSQSVKEEGIMKLLFAPEPPLGWFSDELSSSLKSSCNVESIGHYGF